MSYSIVYFIAFTISCIKSSPIVNFTCSIVPIQIPRKTLTGTNTLSHYHIITIININVNRKSALV